MSPRPSPRPLPGPPPQAGSQAPPLSTMVRVTVLLLEQDPKLALSREQAARLKGLLPAITQSLVRLDRGERDPEAPRLEREFRAVLTPAQLAFLEDHAEDPAEPLLVRGKENPLVREIQRLVEARSAGKAYSPLLDKGSSASRGTSR